jgi:hypothetical protein
MKPLLSRSRYLRRGMRKAGFTRRERRAFRAAMSVLPVNRTPFQRDLAERFRSAVTR